MNAPNELRRFVLVETGEKRSPRFGEYYIDTKGNPQRAEMNFSSWAEYSILRLVAGNDQVKA
jgi:hypothetical protein